MEMMVHGGLYISDIDVIMMHRMSIHLVVTVVGLLKIIVNHLLHCFVSYYNYILYFFNKAR